MEILKQWWFYIIVVAVLILLYFILGTLEIIPTYQCGTTMGIDRAYEWCTWSYGPIAG